MCPDFMSVYCGFKTDFLFYNFVVRRYDFDRQQKDDGLLPTIGWPYVLVKGVAGGKGASLPKIFYGNY